MNLHEFTKTLRAIDDGLSVYIIEQIYNAMNGDYIAIESFVKGYKFGYRNGLLDGHDKEAKFSTDWFYPWDRWFITAYEMGYEDGYGDGHSDGIEEAINNYNKY